MDHEILLSTETRLDEILLTSEPTLEELMLHAEIASLEGGMDESSIEYKIHQHDIDPEAHKELQEKYDKKISDLDTKTANKDTELNNKIDKTKSDLIGTSSDSSSTMTLNGLSNKIKEQIESLDSSVEAGSGKVLAGITIVNGKITAHKEYDLTNFYQFKGSVETESDLPTSGMRSGDVYNIVQRSSYGMGGMNVAWVVQKSSSSGGYWDKLGSGLQIDYASYNEVTDVLNACL